MWMCVLVYERLVDQKRERRGRREWSVHQLSAVRLGKAKGVGISAWFGYLCTKFFTPLVLSQQRVAPRLLGLVLIPAQPAATQHEKGLPYFPNLLLCEKRVASRGHCFLPPSCFISQVSATPCTSSSAPRPTSPTPLLCLQLINLVTPFNHMHSTSCQRGEGESPADCFTVTEKESEDKRERFQSTVYAT